MLSTSMIIKQQSHEENEHNNMRIYIDSKTLCHRLPCDCDLQKERKMTSCTDHRHHLLSVFHSSFLQRYPLIRQRIQDRIFFFQTLSLLYIIVWTQNMLAGGKLRKEEEQQEAKQDWRYQDYEVSEFYLQNMHTLLDSSQLP